MVRVGGSMHLFHVEGGGVIWHRPWRAHPSGVGMAYGSALSGRAGIVWPIW